MLRALNKTGLVFFPAFDWAISPNHPEREERLLYTQDQIFEEGLFDIEGIIEYKPEMCTVDDIRRVHFCVPDEPSVTTESHFISAGGAKTIARKVMEKTVDRGFAMVRPPGHHARRVVHGSRGFCNVNIEAIMIEYLRSVYHIDRVAIVDTDCHHGDGTQDIYWHDPDTLFISIHQDGRTLYPGSGFPTEFGGPNAAGYTVNVPLPPNTSEEGFLHTMEHLVMPVLDDFAPDIVINSAGQDNHYTDPITNMNFSAQGYAKLTTMLNPDIAVLEGGYSIEGALPYVNLGIVLALAGMDYSCVHEPDYNPESIRQSPETSLYIEKLCEAVLNQWENREELKQKVRGNKSFVETDRSVFYDTDGILERQKETARVCEDCGGVWKMVSDSDRGGRIHAVHIPRKVCGKCREQGMQWHDSKEAKSHDLRFLRDRDADRYLIGKR